MSWLGWLRRHLVARPARTSVSVTAVVIGVAAYVGVASGTRAVIAAIRRMGVAADPDAVEFFESIEQSLAPLAGAALLVSGFIIHLTTTRTVGDRQVTFGTMRALGASRRTVIAVVLAEAALIGAVGTALGLALGRLLGPAIGETMAGTFGISVGDSGGASLTTTQLLVAVLGGLLVPPVAAAVPAVRASRVEPASAMRHVSDDSGVPSWRGLVGLIAFGLGTAWAFVVPGDAKSTGVLVAMIGLLVGVPLLVSPVAGVVRSLLLRSRPGLGDIAAAQLARRRGRTAVTAGLVAGTLTLVFLVQTVVASQRPAFVGAVETTLGADAEVGLPPPGGPAAVDALSNAPGVMAATPVWRHRAEVTGDRRSTENLTVIDAATYFEVAAFTWTRGTDGDSAAAALRRPGSVVISTNVADATGAERDDVLTVSTAGGEGRFRVAGVYYGLAYGATDAVVMSEADAAGVLPLGDPATMLVDFAPGVAADTWGGVAALGLPPGASYSLNAQLRSDIVGQFDGIFGLVQAIAVLIALLGLAGMANTLAMEILDRRQEFGVLRAIGLQRREVVRLVVLEGALLAAVSVLVALAAGTVLGFALADSGAGGIDELDISLRFPVTAAAVFAVVAVVAGGLASVLPGRAAARVSPTDLLRLSD